MQDKPIELAHTGDGAAAIAIKKALKEKLLAQPPSTKAIRGSNGGKCSKAMWAQVNGVERESVPEGRFDLLLKTGKMLEPLLIAYFKNYLLGPGRFYRELYFGEPDQTFAIDEDGELHVYNQPPWEGVTPLGVEWTTSPDGYGVLHNGEVEGIDFKSAASHNFTSAADLNQPAQEAIGSYLGQAHAIMGSKQGRELGMKRFRFFYINKNTSDMADRLIMYSEEAMEDVHRRFNEAAGDKPPKDGHELVPEMTGRKPNKKPTGRLTAPWQCRYCAYTKWCKGDYTIEFKSGRPIYVFTQSNEEGA